ncbi:MAG: hypothetical protein NTW19_15405 [Planctomycetota bacterium]|nr:hypothetical protein [Planctomycetota bacterium]
MTPASLHPRPRAKPNVATLSALAAALTTVGGWVWLASADRSAALASSELHQTRLVDLEQRMRKAEASSERLARVEEKIDGLRADLARIERKLP